jgi:hypothetical protein
MHSEPGGLCGGRSYLVSCRLPGQRSKGRYEGIDGPDFGDVCEVPIILCEQGSDSERDHRGHELGVEVALPDDSVFPAQLQGEGLDVSGQGKDLERRQ